MGDRKVILLKAAYDLLNKQRQSRYVLDLLSETVFYDEADCDGHCLMDDIEIELKSAEHSEVQQTNKHEQEKL